MNDEELKESLDGLYAYDRGLVPSGVHDDRLKTRVAAEVWADCPRAALFGPRITRIAGEMFASSEAIQGGYGLEDLQRFVEWLDTDLRLFFGASR